MKPENKYRQHLIAKGIVATFLLCCLTIIASTGANAQIECATIVPKGRTLKEAAPYGDPSQLTGYSSIEALKHVNLAVHVVRYSNGTGGISSNDITTSVSQLNTAYSSVPVAFSVASTDYINNDTYANLNLDGNYTQLFQVNRVNGALNVYYVISIIDNSGGQYNGVAEDIPGRALAIKNSAAVNGTTLPHEVGHDFDLYHTHETAFGAEKINRTDLPGCPKNWDFTGDLLGDTPADPNLLYRTGGSCQYLPGNPVPVDPCGNSNYTPDMRNLMSYAAQCRNEFSLQQIARMNYALTNLISDLIQVSVAVSNKVNGSTHSGSTLTINNQVITSPGNVSLLDGNMYPGKTNHERLSGDNKHKDWNSVTAEYTLSKDFTVDRTTQIGRTRDANFVGLNPVTVTTQLIDASGSGGNVQFRDPWYLADASGNQPNQFLSYTAPFCPTGAYNQTAGGVFLDQRYDIPGNPYYSVGAPNSNTINGYTGYFDSWTGSNATLQSASSPQTAVVFTASGATATAKYKGHLISSLSNATASNSQRVAAGLPYGQSDNQYVLAYASGGELWWINSYDDGGYWWYDTRFTNSSGTASAPSIAMWTDCVIASPLFSPCDTYMYAVYRKESGGNHQIMFTIPPFPNTGVSSSTQINSTSVSTSADTRPVITRLDDYGTPFLYAFWNGPSGIYLNYAQWYSTYWSWSGEQLLFSGNYRNPSVSGSSDLNFYLTYDDGSNIKILDYYGYLDGTVPASVSPTSFSSQVSSDTRVDPSEAFVVWEAYGGEEQGTNRGDSWQKSNSVIQQHRVMYQHWTGSAWNNAHEFHSSTQSINYYRPTISNLSSGNIVWAWDNGSTTYKAVYNGSWSVTESESGIIMPNLVGGASKGPLATTRFAATGTSGPPYAIAVGDETTRPSGNSMTSNLPLEYSRLALHFPPNLLR